MRVLIAHDPLLNPNEFHHEDSPWPAKWVAHPEHWGIDDSVVIAYRRRFVLKEPQKFRLHVSADQRYELFVDGQRAGRGPERGDRLNWFYETYELDVAAGEHVIVARTWWLRDDAPTPYAQITVRPAFFAMGEAMDAKPQAAGDAQKRTHELLSTGIAPWECKRLGGYMFEKPQVHNAFLVSGAKVRIDGYAFDWGSERGEGDGWVRAVENGLATPASIDMEARPDWLLRPATLPAEIEQGRMFGVVRHVADAAKFDRSQAVRARQHIRLEADRWTELLGGRAKLTIPAGTSRRVIVDLDDYFCAYPQLVVSGGAGASIELHWAESLYEDPARHVKGNRNEVEGKVFAGIGDTFLPDGGEKRLFETLWWEAGRYLQFVIRTHDEPLALESFSIRENHYPHKFESRFESSDPRLAEIVRPARRTLEMCSHETYMDCPYYEQLMYAGDTRLQVLVTYATTRDGRLPRKALETFDYSRAASSTGMTMARYPTKVLQTIPPFSLWWIGMVHDYQMWRDDADFVRARLPGVRAVLEAFRRNINNDHLLESPKGWNFVDWVPGWSHGMPPGANPGEINGTLNWHFVYTLLRAAELERFVGEHDLARRNVKTAADVSVACDAFWDDRRGLFAEDRAKTTFSEHTQCLALLSEPLCALHRPRVGEHLLVEPGMAQTTIYFSHYLFEAYRLLGRADRMIERMSLWFDLKKNGNRTTIEMPEPTRSDCHAWGAHPVYHYYASILGIRPAEPLFKRVRIEPQLGKLTRAKGTLVHPRGEIAVDVSLKEGKLTGEVRLPGDVSGELIVNGNKIELPAEPQDACMMPHPF
jgi:hypothetical protein